MGGVIMKTRSFNYRHDTFLKKLFEQDGFILDASQIQDISLAARYFEQYAEHMCNTPDTDPLHQWIKRKHDLYLEKLKAMNTLKMIPDFKVTYDPRGYTLKFFFKKSNIWNTWGGKEEGFGIPTDRVWKEVRKEMIRYLK